MDEEEYIELSDIKNVENVVIDWMRGLKEMGEFNMTPSFLILAICGIVNIS